MPDSVDSPALRKIIREVVQEENERIGIYARDTPGVQRTRRNFVSLDNLADREEAIKKLLEREAEAERDREEAERASDEDRRDRKSKRYEALLGLLASLAQYGLAGLLGYLVSLALSHWRH